MKKTLVVILLAELLSMNAFANLNSLAQAMGPALSGGSSGRQFMTCDGIYKKQNRVVTVTFNARITPGPNVGTVTTTTGKKTLNLNSALIEDSIDPRGYVYKGEEFLVLVPGHQQPNDDGTYSAFLTAARINAGKSIVLTCSK